MDYTVTMKVKLSLVADSRLEVDSDAIHYCMGLMCVTGAEVLDIEVAPDDTVPACDSACGLDHDRCGDNFCPQGHDNCTLLYCECPQHG